MRTSNSFSLQRTFDIVADALRLQGAPALEPWGPMLLDRDGRRSAIGHLLGGRLLLTNVAALELVGVARLVHDFLPRHNPRLVIALEAAHDAAAHEANNGRLIFTGGRMVAPDRWMPLWVVRMQLIARAFGLRDVREVLVAGERSAEVVA
jgi:hypothetical protein